MKSKLTKGTKINYLHNGSFHEAIGPGNRTANERNLIADSFVSNFEVLRMGKALYMFAETIACEARSLWYFFQNFRLP